MPAFQPSAWIHLLEAHQVAYVVVGGYAGQLHGARRPTLDIDVVPDWAHENLQRLCDALRSVNASSITGPPVEGRAITPEVIIDREVMTWQTDLGRIDTLLGIPNAEGEPVDYRQLHEHASDVELPTATVAVASLDDIITSKEYASRRKDAEALPELRRLRDERPRQL